jgi:hypothetical protein
MKTSTYALVYDSQPTFKVRPLRLKEFFSLILILQVLINDFYIWLSSTLSNPLNSGIKKRGMLATLTFQYSLYHLLFYRAVPRVLQALCMIWKMAPYIIHHNFLAHCCDFMSSFCFFPRFLLTKKI